MTTLARLVAGRLEYGAADQLGNSKNWYTERLFGWKAFRGRSLICHMEKELEGEMRFPWLRRL